MRFSHLDPAAARLAYDGPAGKSRWPQRLEMSELSLCPYQPEYCVVGRSAILAEALLARGYSEIDTAKILGGDPRSCA